MKTFLTFPTAQSAMTISRTFVLWLMFPILCPITLFTQGESCDCPSGYDEIFIVGGLNGALASDVFSAHNHNVNNTCIHVNGVLILDTYVNFTNCRFFMNSGSQIIVKNYSLLGSYSTSYQSCTNQMWQGILFEDYGWTIFKNSNIRDALFALHASSASISVLLRVQNSTFTDNFIGIYNPRESGGFSIAQPFIGNRFRAITPLLTPPPSTHEDPWYEAGAYSFAGIISYEDALFIGKTNAPITERNYFENLMCGISGIDNVQVVKGCVFRNIPGLASGNQFNSLNASLGIAVNTGVSGTSTLSGSLALPLVSVSGFGKNNTNAPSFTNVQIAVSCNGTDCFVTDNLMTSVNTGVSCANIIAHREPGGIYINSNSITHLQDGIYVSNCSASRIEIKSNEMKSTTSASFFSNQILLIQNVSADIHIVDNYLYPTVQLFGLRLSNSPAAEVAHNHVNWQSVGPVNGRTSYNFSYSPSIISCNDASNQGYQLTQTNGFRLSNSENSVLDCNVVNDHYRAYWVLSNNMDADLLTNSTQNCNFGWYYGITGISGEQLNKGNIYTGNFNIGAQHDGSNIYIGLSEYLVRPSGNNDYPHGTQADISTPNGNIQWYYTLDSMSPPICMLNCGTNKFADPRNNDDIINWYDGPDWYNDESRWEARSYLIRRILEDPELTIEYPDLFNFYSQSIDSLYLKLESIEFGIDHMFDPNENQHFELQFYFTARLNALNVIDSVQSILNEEDSAVYSVQLQFLDSLFSIVDSVGVELSEIMTEIHSNAIYKADSLFSVNAALSPIRLVETNAIEFNEIVLDCIRDQRSFTPTELNELQSLADQCAYSGGTSVFRARAIMGAFAPQDQDDELLCSLPLPLILSNGQLEVDPTVTLYPNPVAEILNLSTDQNFKNARIIDSFGKPIMNLSLGQDQNVDVKVLPKGLYFLQLSSDAGIKILKFIKQ